MLAFRSKFVTNVAPLASSPAASPATGRDDGGTLLQRQEHAAADVSLLRRRTEREPGFGGLLGAGSGGASHPHLPRVPFKTRSSAPAVRIHEALVLLLVSTDASNHSYNNTQPCTTSSPNTDS